MGHRDPSFATSKRYPDASPLYGALCPLPGRVRKVRSSQDLQPLATVRPVARAHCPSAYITAKSGFRQYLMRRPRGAPIMGHARVPSAGPRKDEGGVQPAAARSSSVRARNRVEAKELARGHDTAFYVSVALIVAPRNRCDIITRGLGFP